MSRSGRAIDLVDSWKTHDVAACEARPEVGSWGDDCGYPHFTDPWDVVNALLDIDPRFTDDQLTRAKDLAARLGATAADLEAITTASKWKEWVEARRERPDTVTTDPIVLHKRVVRLIDLASKHGASDDAIRAALDGPLHPDRVNMPAEGRLPAIDPAPYLAAMSRHDRIVLSLPFEEYATCGVQVTLEDSVRIRDNGWDGITTCVLPEGHYRGWGEGSLPPHVGILIGKGITDQLFGPALWQWLGPVRELGQVAPR